MTDSAKYVKIVEWSEEDGSFVGQCPGIIGPCCHGANEADVYRDLCPPSFRSGSTWHERKANRYRRQPREKMSRGLLPEYRNAVL